MSFPIRTEDMAQDMGKSVPSGLWSDFCFPIRTVNRFLFSHPDCVQIFCFPSGFGTFFEPLVRMPLVCIWRTPAGTGTTCWYRYLRDNVFEQISSFYANCFFFFFFTIVFDPKSGPQTFFCSQRRFRTF